MDQAQIADLFSWRCCVSRPPAYLNKLRYNYFVDPAILAEYFNVVMKKILTRCTLTQQNILRIICLSWQIFKDKVDRLVLEAQSG